MKDSPEQNFRWKERALAFLVETGTVDYFVNTEAYRNNAVFRFHVSAGCDDVFLLKKVDDVADTILVSSQAELTGTFTQVAFLNNPAPDELYTYHGTITLPMRSHFLKGNKSVIYIPLAEANYEGSIVISWQEPFELTSDYKKFLNVCINRLKEVIRLNFAFDTLEELRVKFMAVFNTVTHSLVFLDNEGGDSWLNPPAIDLLDLAHSPALTPQLISENMRKLRERASNAEDIITQAAEFFKQPGKSFSNWLWKYENRVLNVSNSPINSEHIKGRLWVFEDISEVFFNSEKLQWLNAELFAANEEIKNSFYSVSEKNELIKEQNKEIKYQNEKLEIINREKDNLIGIVSHDLRTPLQQVKGLTEILLSSTDKLTADQQFIIDRMAQSIDRGLTLIKDLLDVTQLEHQAPQTLQPLNVSDLIADEIPVHQQSAAKKNIRVQLSMLAVSTTVMGDRDIMNRILDNLISNAIKFTDRGKSIYITVANRERELLISIRDEGQGITETDKKKLFQKFTKLSARPTAGESSTGLGLYIAKTLIESLHGSISCASEWQQGTTFTIHLPLTS